MGQQHQPLRRKRQGQGQQGQVKQDPRSFIGAGKAAASLKPRYREIVQNGQIIFVERGGGCFAFIYMPSKILTAPIVVLGPEVVVERGYCDFGTKIG